MRVWSLIRVTWNFCNWVKQAQSGAQATGGAGWAGGMLHQSRAFRQELAGLILMTRRIWKTVSRTFFGRDTMLSSPLCNSLMLRTQPSDQRWSTDRFNEPYWWQYWLGNTCHMFATNCLVWSDCANMSFIALLAYSLFPWLFQARVVDSPKHYAVV